MYLIQLYVVLSPVGDEGEAATQICVYVAVIIEFSIGIERVSPE